jgi:predicted nucleic acid-binding protein
MLYAAADRGDRSNARAIDILSSGERLVASDHVLVESWILLSHRLGHAAAERQWAAIRSGAVVVEPVVAADLETAFEIGQRFPDQRFPVVDRTSFAVMQRLGILRVATFDEHFAIYRFGPRMRFAFELVR